MPASNPRALESAGAFLQRVARIDAALCPCCGQGRLRTVQVLASPARLPAPGQEATMEAPAPQGRGPP